MRPCIRSDGGRRACAAAPRAPAPGAPPQARTRTLARTRTRGAVVALAALVVLAAVAAGALVALAGAPAATAQPAALTTYQPASAPVIATPAVGARLQRLLAARAAAVQQARAARVTLEERLAAAQRLERLRARVAARQAARQARSLNAFLRQARVRGLSRQQLLAGGTRLGAAALTGLAARAAAGGAARTSGSEAMPGTTATAMPGMAMTPQPGGTPDYFGVANWAYSPPLRKFVDTLPGLDAPNSLGNFIPVAVPDTTSYPGSDTYELAVVQFEQQLHSDLPPTTLRGYVQLETPANAASSAHYLLTYPDGTPIRDAAGDQVYAYRRPLYLGPMIVAQKGRPVRVVFHNYLPTGEAGKLFLPVDTTVMGAGMGEYGMDPPTGPMDYTENRAVIHLHGGKTVWISDGTPHQWLTPAGEDTAYPHGPSLRNVPDMPDPGEGATTYFYSDQQSARLLFYHDHSWGITRLNVYAGEVAPYLLRDAVEQDLVARGVLPAEELPLIIQDKSFVDAATVRTTDPTWNWGSGPRDGAGVVEPRTGDLWYPHVYVPAQNPYDLAGVNPYGRWHYGPWFWPPTTDTVQPVPNPYYDPENAPWEPPEAPGVPDVSMPGESFFDTALVNGAAYPTLTVQPKAYRFRILNGSNDRFWNLQLYEADPGVVTSDGRTGTEVRMVPAAPGTGLPETWPTDGREGGVPDPASAGPDWIQVGTEGGFLARPAVIPSQPITWNLDPTTFNFGNVDQHSLLLAPAERADVVVDFSAYAGKTLILYNDAPAAFPALDARYDYYTGAPDLTDVGGTVGAEPGFSPNTRTIMQIRVADAAPEPYDLAALEAEFTTGDGHDGVFKRDQNPILVAQAPYGPAYGTTFPRTWPLWGYARIQDKSMQVRTVAGDTLTIPFQPKAIQDEMGEAYDEYGRMSGKLGLELPNTSARTQNFVLQNFVDPATEVIDDSSSFEALTPVLGDGTQIWKITHNGVDTHPIHFHLYDVQLINRVGWDGAIRPPDPNELGWKDTVRVSPLEDTIVALRATKPLLPFGVPDSVRPLNPAEPLGSTMGFTSIDPTTGQPIVPPVTNQVVNFGWEYVWHCHILSHEEMDMMRPVVFRVRNEVPAAPVLGGAWDASGAVPRADLTWTDATPWDGSGPQATLGDPHNEVGFRLERATLDAEGLPGPWEVVATALANQTAASDATVAAGSAYLYRVVAWNAAGEAASEPLPLGDPALVPAAPSDLVATVARGADWFDEVTLTWVDNAANETRQLLQRAEDAAFAGGPEETALAADQTTTTLVVSHGRTHRFRLRAENGPWYSAWSNVAVVETVPLTPVDLRATARSARAITVAWADLSANEDGYEVERRRPGGEWAAVATTAADATAWTDSGLARGAWEYRVRGVNATGASAWSEPLRTSTRK